MPAVVRTPGRSLVPSLHRHRRALCIALLGALVGAGCRSRFGEDGVAVADGGGAPTGSSLPAQSAPPASTPQAATGRTIDVQMVGDGSGYRFVPATVTIKAGDTVRWTNVSGGPHNVTFWADSIPTDAASGLEARMPQSTSPLSGPLLTSPNATYTISFANAPAGTYGYYCTPHLALGMAAKIVVEQ